MYKKILAKFLVSFVISANSVDWGKVSARENEMVITTPTVEMNDEK